MTSIPATDAKRAVLGPGVPPSIYTAPIEASDEDAFTPFSCSIETLESPRHEGRHLGAG